MARSQNTNLNRAAPHDPILNGLLVIAFSRTTVVPIAETDVASSPTWDGLQSGPLLVLNGRSALPDDPRGDMLQVIKAAMIRAFVAVDSSGRVVLGWFDEVTLPDLV